MSDPTYVYLIGSLRNPGISKISERLRSIGLHVFDDWLAAGREADDEWQRYEISRGRSYRDALEGEAARHVFSFDLRHLNRCGVGVLCLPAGKSGHLELGYIIGQGKPGYVLFDHEPKPPERWDIMYQFATGVFFTEDELCQTLQDAYIGCPQTEPSQPRHIDTRLTSSRLTSSEGSDSQLLGSTKGIVGVNGVVSGQTISGIGGVRSTPLTRHLYVPDVI